MVTSPQMSRRSSPIPRQLDDDSDGAGSLGVGRCLSRSLANLDSKTPDLTAPSPSSMEGFGNFEFGRVSVSAASDGKSVTATEVGSDGEAAEDAAASSEELAVVTSIVLQPHVSGRLCE